MRVHAKTEDRTSTNQRRGPVVKSDSIVNSLMRASLGRLEGASCTLAASVSSTIGVAGMLSRRRRVARTSSSTPALVAALMQ